MPCPPARADGRAPGAAPARTPGDCWLAAGTPPASPRRRCRGGRRRGRARTVAGADRRSGPATSSMPIRRASRSTGGSCSTSRRLPRSAIRTPMRSSSASGSATTVELPKKPAGTDELHSLTVRPTIPASRKTAAATLRHEDLPEYDLFVLLTGSAHAHRGRGVQIEQYRPCHARGQRVQRRVLEAEGPGSPHGCRARPRCQKPYLKVRQAL
jgi:hypothetical protein